jgi:type I restriction enzyme S subunit
MTPNLKPYPAYKDSGVSWLGKVPEHWEVRRLGNLLQERKEINDALQVVELLSVLREKGVIPYAEKGNVGNKASDDISRYKIVRPNDIVVNSMNVIIGSVGISKFQGCISPVYYILKPRENQDNPRYLNAYFQTKPFQHSLIRLGKGILSHRMRIPMELLKSEQFPRPSADEQTAIVRFLDYMDRRI